MQAGQVQGHRVGPTGQAKRVFGFMQDGNHMWASRKWEQSLLKTCRETYRLRIWQKRSMSLIFAWGLGFLLMTVVWHTCPLRYPGTGQNKDRGQVSIISHLFPGARGRRGAVLGVQMSSSYGLEYVHGDLTQALLRYYLLCWKTPKISLSSCILQEEYTWRCV